MKDIGWYIAILLIGFLIGYGAQKRECHVHLHEGTAAPAHGMCGWIYERGSTWDRCPDGAAAGTVFFGAEPR